MVILHLSDIHFGRDNPEYKVKGVFQNKKQILHELLVSIRDNSIKPDHIIVRALKNIVFSNSILRT